MYKDISINVVYNHPLHVLLWQFFYCFNLHEKKSFLKSYKKIFIQILELKYLWNFNNQKLMDKEIKKR